MTAAALSLFLIYGGLVTVVTVYFFYRVLTIDRRKNKVTEGNEEK
jgi:hypothetical protein